MASAGPSRSAQRRHRLPPNLQDVSEHWTVFGQVMENEGLSPRSPMSAAWMTPRTPVSAKWPPLRVQHFESIMARLEEDTHSPEVPPTPPPEEDGLGPAPEEPHGSDTSEQQVPSKWSQIRQAGLPLLYKNILKCAVAYLLASLFTFSPWLSHLIHDDDGPVPLTHMGHLIAIVCLDFNPAKTMGAMLEADLFFICGVIYSTIVCTVSMSIFWSLEYRPGWEWLGDFLMILCIAVSIGFVIWTRTRMASLQYNAACTMTAIIHFVVLVKQGGFDMLSHVIFIVFCGCFASTLVSFCLWPQSATTVLQDNISKTIDSFSTLLDLMTNTFLLEEGLNPPSFEKLQRAVEDHQDSFIKLKRQLLEAKTEWYMTIDGTSAPGKEGKRTKAYEDAVDSLNRLAQHLNGLRGGTRLQYELTQAGLLGPHANESGSDDEENAQLKAAAAMFADLVSEVGRPLKNVTRTCTATLKRLRTSFEHARASKEIVFRPEEFTDLSDKVDRALVEFEKTSNDAVLRIYRRSTKSSISLNDLLHLHGHHSGAVASTPENEQVFLLYFFIFTFQEFAKEMASLIDAMERIYTVEHQRLSMLGTFKALWERMRRPPTPISSPVTSKYRKNGLRKKISAILVPERRSRPSFPRIQPHAPDTMQTPSWTNLSILGRIKHTIWAIGTRLWQRDTKHAIRSGLAAAILATPAFLPSTRELFVEYWGDWALISFFVVMSPTIGATNYLSLHRIVATLGGAGVGAAIYTAFPGNAIVLAIFGFFFSLPCFYFIVRSPYYFSAGRFVLLTYSLTCLYCYNLRGRAISAVDIAYHRSVAVIVGVVWAGLVSRFWWPSEARRELSKALSDFCLNVGWLYTRLVVSNSFARDPEDDDATEQTALLASQQNGVNDSIHKYMAMELHLQIQLLQLQDLLAQTEHEPRLKGPFPVHLYRDILVSLQTILDRLHSMRCVTTREEWYTTVRTQFIIPVNKEQHDMVGNIILFLSILASSFRSKTPLPPYLPPAEESRQRLVEAIRQLDVVRSRDVQGSKQLLFFAYALTMKGVTTELERLAETLQDAFGVMAPEFRGFFIDPKQIERRIRFAV